MTNINNNFTIIDSAMDDFRANNLTLGEIYPSGSVYMNILGNSLPSSLTALGGWNYLGYIETKTGSSSASSSSAKIAFYQKDNSTPSVSG